MSQPGDGDDPQAGDIVLAILGRIMDLAPGLSTSIAKQVEAEIRQRFGGARVFVPKRKKRLSAEQKERAYKDGLSNKPTDEVVAAHKISRSSLYRLMKRGPGG